MATIKERINEDLKQAMLSGDKQLAMTLRGIKSAILYVEVAKGSRDEGLSDDELIDVLSKEAKKRQESADLFAQGGNQEKADQELAEKAAIERYLPAQMSDEEIATLVDEIVTETGASGPQAMGQVIGAVKARTKGAADGAKIANIVKERLSK